MFLILFGGAISAMVAASKGRNVIGWLVCGALFPVISVVAILCLPSAVPPPEATTPR
jgi:hypothetical protein